VSRDYPALVANRAARCTSYKVARRYTIFRAWRSDMAHSHNDWLRDKGIPPRVDLSKIRFGHRLERPKRLDVSFMGQPAVVNEKPAEEKLRRGA